MLDRDEVVQLSSIIHQNIYMFDETIYDNICLHENYPEGTIEKALLESGLTEFISELPTGLQYRVGENGSNLSGGQKIWKKTCWISMMKFFIWRMVVLKKGEVLNSLSVHLLVSQDIFS